MIPKDGSYKKDKSGNEKVAWLNTTTGRLDQYDDHSGELSYLQVAYSTAEIKGCPDVWTFKTCPQCDKMHFTVTDFVTKGNEPFFNLVSEQFYMLDTCAFLPHIRRGIHPLMQEAAMNVDGDARQSLLNGWDRPRREGEEKGICQPPGDALELSWDAPRELPVLRLKFDPDYSRRSISDNAKMRIFAQKLLTGFDFVPVRPAATMAKGFVIYADGKEIFRTEKNEQSFVKIPLHVQAQKLRILWTASYGAKICLHSLDFMD